MRIAAVAVAVCALLSVTSFADASPVDGAQQALGEDDLSPLEPSHFESYDIRMAPLERWSVRFTAIEDDGKIVCAALINGRKVDEVKKPSDNCILRGVTGKKTDVVNVRVYNAGKATAHYGYSFE